MKFFKFASPALVATYLLLSTSANAFVVDKMIIISDEKGNGFVTLTNDEKGPIFIKSSIEEIEVNNKTDVSKVKYTKENISDWKVSLTHYKLVLKPGESKDIGIRSLCTNTSCDTSRDLMFMLPFVPSPYRPDGQKASGMDINFGFSPLYIIPAKKANISYDIKRKNGNLIINNESNTLINVYVNGCEGLNNSTCKERYTLVSGREKEFRLPDEIKNADLEITVTSHDRSYSRQFNIEGE